MSAPARLREATREARPSLAERTRISHLDPLLATAAIALIAFSVLTLAVTTRNDVPGEPFYFVFRQGIYALLGIGVMVGIARLDYSRFREIRVGLYSLMIAGIAFVLVFGSATRGSHRWVELPLFRFQPSELGKVLLIAALAGFVLDRLRLEPEADRTKRILLLGIAPAALVFLQPDLGTGLVFGIITLSVLFIAGTRWTHFAAIGAAAAALGVFVFAVAPAIGTPVLKGYQEERLTAFLNPSEDPGNSSYQINQALIAVGSGQKTGRGEESTQTRLKFIPERHTDFVFAVVGERFGFAGAAFVLSLYALLIWRGLRILTLSKNLYGTLLAGGIVAMLMFQVFVNVGMSVGIMPITGLPLPLMSYGGSSVLVTFMAVGILQSIFVQSQLASRSRPSPVPEVS